MTAPQSTMAKGVPIVRALMTLLFVSWQGACVFVPEDERLDGAGPGAFRAPLVLSEAPGTEENLASAWAGASRDADLVHVVLDLSLELDSGRIGGAVTHTFRALGRGTQSIRLDAVDLEIREVLDSTGRPLGYRQRGGDLVVLIEDPLEAGDEFTFKVTFAGTPTKGYHSSLEYDMPAPAMEDGTARDPGAVDTGALDTGALDTGALDTGTGSPGRDTADGGTVRAFSPSAYGTSFPAGQRFWFPSWDRPGDLTTVETSILLRDDMSAVSNGVLVALEDQDGQPLAGAAASTSKTGGMGRERFRWRSSIPIPVPSIAIAAAQFTTFAATAGETELFFHLPKGTDPDTAQRSFGESSAIVEYFERRLDAQFPFKRYDQVVLRELPSQLLDGASMTLIDASELPTAADELDDRRERPRRTVSRGVARKWFGAWIAPLEEQHRWLLDGLALTLELDYEARVRGAAEVELEWEAMRDSILRRALGRRGEARSNGASQASGPGAGGELSLARDEATERAAWVLRMIRKRLGEETFWGLLRSLARRDEQRVVTVEDFRRLGLANTGIDLGPQIAQWTTRRTVPELEVRFQRRAVEGVGESLGVVVTQVQAGPLFRLELPIVVHFAGGSTVAETLVLDKERTLWILPLDDSVVDVALDPEGLLLAELDVEKEDASWIAQGALSRSPVDRWHALAKLAELAESEEEARRALTRILLDSSEPSLRERATQFMRFRGPTCDLALEQAATDDPSPRVRRAALHSLLQRFARGDWSPETDAVERLLLLRQRELSPAVREKLDQLLKTVPDS